MYNESEYNKRYWEKNAKRIIEKRHLSGYYKDYYKRTPSWRIKMSEWRKKWKMDNPELAKERQRIALAKWRLTPGYRYQAIKRNAKRKNRDIPSKTEFLEWFCNQTKECHYCGVTEAISKLKMNSVLQIDRKDNSKGYVISNMTLACCFCNGVKFDILTEDEALFVGKNIIKKKWKNLG